MEKGGVLVLWLTGSLEDDSPLCGSAEAEDGEIDGEAKLLGKVKVVRSDVMDGEVEGGAHGGATSQRTTVFDLVCSRGLGPVKAG